MCSRKVMVTFAASNNKTNHMVSVQYRISVCSCQLYSCLIHVTSVILENNKTCSFKMSLKICLHFFCLHVTYTLNLHEWKKHC